MKFRVTKKHLKQINRKDLDAWMAQVLNETKKKVILYFTAFTVGNEFHPLKKDHCKKFRKMVESIRAQKTKKFAKRHLPFTFESK